MTAKPRLTELAAWKALEAHFPQVHDVHLRQLFAADPHRGERLTAEAVGIYLDYSKHRVTDETLALLARAGGGIRPAREHRRHVPRREDQRHRKARRAARRPARALRASRSSSTARMSCPRSTPCSTRWPLSADRVRSGRLEWPHGQAIRNIVNIGIGGSDLGPVMAYEALRHYSRPRPGLPLRLQRRRHRFRRSSPRPRSRETLFIVSSKTFTTLETMTNAHTARDWALKALERRPGRGRAALRGRLDQRRRGCQIRHRHREYVRLLGLGGRSLLDGLGDRTIHDDRRRPGEFPGHARRLPRDGRTLPHRPFCAQPAGVDGPVGLLVQQLLRRANRRRPALRAVPQALSRLSAAVDHGEQRQACHARRPAGRLRRRDRSTGASRAPTDSIPSTS